MRGFQGVKVAFLTRYNRMRASSRVRVYDYLPYLQAMGFECRALPFPEKLTLVTMIRYFAQALWLARWADVVFLQKLVLREAFIDTLEKVNPRIIFDFDDALWAVPDFYKQNLLVQNRHEIQRQRLHRILARVRCVVGGSGYLAEYARKFAPWVEVIPSSVDINQYPPKSEWNDNPIIVGWIGSPENLFDLSPILPALQKLTHQMSETKMYIKVVSARSPDWSDLPFIFEEWKLGYDATILQSFDIGIMPLLDSERSRGRCAFKAVQYMAAGLPVVASPIGGATEVIVDGETGFFASSSEEWMDSLSRLVRDKTLRINLGKAGRSRAERFFSIQANAPKLASILKKVASS